MKRLVLLLAFALVALPCALSAQPLIKPLPTADLSRLPAAVQADIARQRGEFDRLRASLVGPPLADAFARLGILYARHGQFAVAEAALANAAVLVPEDGRLHYLLGVFTAQNGNLAQARGPLERALVLEPDYIPVRYRLADVQIALGDLAAAKATLADVAAKRPDLAPAPALLGEIALREKRYAEAVALLRKALQIDPRATALNGRLADALAASGDKAGADAARAKAGNVPPVYADPLIQNIYASASTSGSPVERALALAAQGRDADARAALDAHLQTNPKDVAALAAYARVLAGAGDASGAQQRATAALAAGPNDARALLAQGVVLEVAGRNSQAIPYYERAVRADPKLAEARLLLGQANQRRSQPAIAAEQFRELVRLAPQDGSAFARLAVVLAQSGRCSEALRETNTALRQRPKDGGLLQTFARLASTCPAASPEERQMAVDYAQSLYKQKPDESHSEALAMALAATGKGADAVDYEAQAIFEALRRNDTVAAERMKPLLERFKAGQKAATPWPAGHPFVAPPLLAARK